jgi:hypothetical protein
LWAEKKTETTAKVKKQKALVDTYNYTDTEGKTLYQVCRFDPKDFRQRAPDGKGDWKWSLKGIKRVLYHLPEVLAAEKVFICEGEKDADAICALGWVATTNAGGASNWIPEYSASLNGKECIILPDNDEPGMKHAQKIARSLNGIAKSVKIVELPDLPQKGDVSNWIGNGNTMDGLLEIVDKTEESGLRIVPDFTGITEEQGQELLMGVSGDARWEAAAHLCKMYSEKGYSDSEVVTLLKKWNVRNLPPFSDVEIEDIVKSEYEKDQQKKFSGIAEAIKRILILKYPDGTTKYKLYMEDNKTTTINVEELLSSRKTCAKIVEATRAVFNPQKQDKWLDLVRVWLNTAKEEEVAIEETDLGIIKEIVGEWTDQWNKHKKSKHINHTSMLANSCVVMDSKIYFILAHLEEDLRESVSTRCVSVPGRCEKMKAWTKGRRS